jgi:hypothetical protein
MLEQLVARVLPYLPSDRLIQAIGNLEQRDDLMWLRQEALAEVDRCLSHREAIEAFEHPAASAVAGLVLARACREGRHEPFPTWLTTYFRQQPHVAAAAILRGALARRVAVPAPAAADAWPRIAQAVAESVRAARQPSALVLTAPTDDRNEQLTRPLVGALADGGIQAVWVRLTASGGGVRLERIGGFAVIDAPLSAAADADDPPPDVRVPKQVGAAAGDPFARAIARAVESAGPQFRLGRALGRAAAGVRCIDREAGRRPRSGDGGSSLRHSVPCVSAIHRARRARRLQVLL